MNRQTIIRQFSSTEYHSNLSLCRDAPVPFPLCLGRSVARGRSPAFSLQSKNFLPSLTGSLPCCNVLLILFLFISWRAAPESWPRNPRHTRACPDSAGSLLWCGRCNPLRCAWHPASLALSGSAPRRCW